MTLSTTNDPELPSNRAKNRIKGNIGEDIACKYLMERGFAISERNYRKPWGELDIVAVKDKDIHFIEVKSVTVRGLPSLKSGKESNRDGIPAHSPEENVDGFKLKQIRKMIRTYFNERALESEKEFQFHVICVYLDMNRRLARARWIQNIII